MATNAIESNSIESNSIESVSLRDRSIDVLYLLCGCDYDSTQLEPIEFFVLFLSDIVKIYGILSSRKPWFVEKR